MSTSDLTCCVVDKGLFLPVALRLGRDVKKCYYWSPHETDFESVTGQIGDGFPEIERIDSVWEIKDECDLFVFPDVGFFGLQHELRSQGYPVLGSGDGGRLETMRGTFLKMLGEIGLPVPKHEKVTGIERLIDYVRGQKDLYIKISRYRREGETFHWRSWDEDRDRLYELGVALGPFSNRITFYVFKPIDTDIEDGLDTFAVGSDYPELAIHGVECKDKAYLGTFQPYTEVPAVLRRVNEAIAPVLAEHDYRGPFSTEVRITKEGEGFFIDPTCRFGSPPHQCQSEMIENYAEVLYDVARGEVPYLVPAHKFGLQVVINSGRCGDSWTYMKVPKSVRQWVKPSKAVFADGMICGVPDPKFSGCEDWLVGVGDTIEEAVEHIQRNAVELPDGCCCDLSPIAELIQEVQAAEERDMEFTDQPVPGPEIVLT